MRFILGFIFFGLLFYAMSIYLPDAFQTLVSWAAKTFDYLRDLVQAVANKIGGPSGSPHTPIGPESPKALLFWW